MKKRAAAFVLLLMFCISVLPVCASGITPLEPDRMCSLDVIYGKDNVAFPGLQIRIYRVARANADGSFDLIAPYSGYPVNIHGITAKEEWQETATALAGYVVSDNIDPYRTQKTDADGVASFTRLETGLYLVAGITTENDTGTYVFEDFMIYLPTPVDDGFDYDMEARPKCSSFVPKEEYKVTKLWKDTGYTSSRPSSVSVEIHKDGVLQQTVTLNASNNWTYTWRVSVSDTGKWTVAEKNVPDQYKVTVSENAGSFTITNTRQTSPGNPPKTGDTFLLGPWVMAMCLSGSLLLVLSIYGRRKL